MAGLAAYEAGRTVVRGAGTAGGRMAARVAGTACLAVVGASGSGKSSVVWAGLLAGLADGQLPGSAGWDLVGDPAGSTPGADSAEQVLARRQDAGAILRG